MEQRSIIANRSNVVVVSACGVIYEEFSLMQKNEQCQNNYPLNFLTIDDMKNVLLRKDMQFRQIS